MQINFNTYSISRPSFAKNSQSYNIGFNHGKNDGLIGSSSQRKQNNDFEINKEDYEKGYNRGYNIGKAGRLSNTATVSDVIQELVDSGTSREQARKFASLYLGGW
ncbi:MAG: hypothetical protein IJY61_08885 [Candidatus Gastranaerophilales bacterium]|nr:hypothetical protein [Candidatus Gastranaerophilales bacterium]